MLFRDKPTRLRLTKSVLRKQMRDQAAATERVKRRDPGPDQKTAFGEGGRSRARVRPRTPVACGTGFAIRILAEQPSGRPPKRLSILRGLGGW